VTIELDFIGHKVRKKRIANNVANLDYMIKLIWLRLHVLDLLSTVEYKSFD